MLNDDSIFNTLKNYISDKMTIMTYDVNSVRLLNRTDYPISHFSFLILH